MKNFDDIETKTMMEVREITIKELRKIYMNLKSMNQK